MAPNMNHLVHGRDLKLTHISRCFVPHLAHTSSPSLGCDALFVRGEIEGNKEEEIGRKDADPSESGEFFTGALSLYGEIGEVGTGEVIVGCVVDEAC